MKELFEKTLKLEQQGLKPDLLILGHKKIDEFREFIVVLGQNQGAQLTWVITKDHEVCNDCENATHEQIERLKLAKYTEPFKMFDDDGNLYYSGLAKIGADFDPLDDFGTPNAGCTEIQYYNTNTKKYETL